MVIILNPYAGGGKAIQKWNKIKSHIYDRMDTVEIILLSKKVTMKECVADLLNQGQNEFIAGGGDGTVNLLLQNLIKFAPSTQLDKIKIGAIGLGSSNDFHKPFKDHLLINRIPCLLDFTFAKPRDVGILIFSDNNAQNRKKYWIINASIGITSEANLFFNTPDFLLNNLKKSMTNAAILYAAFRTIATYHNRDINIRIGNNEPKKINLTNMGVAKSPHFSGNFSYNTPFETDNGKFYINICRDMHFLNTLSILWNLSKNKFCGLPKTESYCSNHLTVESNQKFAVEFDGEVIATQKANFSIKQKMIRVCTC